MILSRKFSALLVQPEQLFMVAGHLPASTRTVNARSRVCQAHQVYARR